jgi:hypothetical protein
VKNCLICDSTPYSSTEDHIETHCQEVLELCALARESGNSRIKFKNEVENFMTEEPSQALEKICQFCDLSMSSNFTAHVNKFHLQEYQSLAGPSNEMLQKIEKAEEIMGLVDKMKLW